MSCGNYEDGVCTVDGDLCEYTKTERKDCAWFECDCPSFCDQCNCEE
jgi:hypothetical protein